MIDFPIQTLPYIDNLDSREAEKALESIHKFRQHLLQANKSINLISRKDSEAIFWNLCFDSLAILELIDYSRDASLLDIGSGAGFPSIPHKILRPDIRVISVDSNRRKIEFQRSASTILDFQRAEFHAARVENLSPLEADYAIAKAFGSVPLICELAEVHLKSGAILILPRTSIQDLAEIHPQFSIHRTHNYRSSPKGKESVLVMLKKN